MVDKRLATLVERLHEKTTSGRSKWREGIDSGEYQIDFPNYSIFLTNEKDRHGNFSVKLAIINSNGTYLEDVHEKSLKQEIEYYEAGNKLSELYELARRQALKVDESIDELLRQID